MDNIVIDNMKSKLYLIVMLLAVILPGVTSCQMNWGPEVGDNKMYVTKGVYVLNEGIGTEQPGSVAYYDIETTKILAGDLFMSSNGHTLGYGPSDMYIYGTHCYIAAKGNKALYVTDSLCRVQKTIAIEDRTPVSVIGYGGKIYVTYAEGYLGQIDTASFNVSQLAVGKSPAGVAGAGNKIYVANSGNAETGYGNTLTVVDPKNMSVLREVELESNPYYLMADYYGDVYAITLGDGQSGSAFWRISSADDRPIKVTNMLNPIRMALSVDTRMVILRKTENGYGIDLYDTYYDVWESAFLQDGEIKDEVSAIGSDLINGYVYVGISNGAESGKVVVYSYYGRKIAELPEIGYAPKSINSRYELVSVPY